MSSILEGALAAEVSKRLETAGVAYDVTITRTVPGVPDPEAPWIEVPDVVTEHACRGWVDAFDVELIAAELVQQDDVKIVVLAASLGTFWPESPDTVTVRGETYTILGVEADPARATVTLRAASA